MYTHFMQYPIQVLLLVLSFIISERPTYGQEAYQEKEVTLLNKSGTLFGTMTLPENADTSTPVSLIIAGSGPTDRNGNNPMMTNNSLMMLAHRLAEKGIASIRYDKRGVAASHEAMSDESELRFNDYVRDAVAWKEKITGEYQLGEFSVIGHSEGSLIGIEVATQTDIAKFISIAGPAQSADEMLRQQLADQPDPIKNPSYQIIDSLAAGHRVQNVPSQLDALFRPSVQPYLISWFGYNPQNIIGHLDIPVLIVQGTTDIQVSVAQAKMLSQSAAEGRLLIIEGMNHILKKAPPQKTPNAMTYNQPNLPVVQEAVDGISAFILSP